MQSNTTAAGHRKDHTKGRGDGATNTSSSTVYHGTSAAVNDSTKPKAYGDPSGSSASDDDNPAVIAMKNEITGRFVPRGPSSEPVKGAPLKPLKPTGSRRDQHRQPPPGSSARGSNIPPKAHTPATTATQPTTAGSGGKRRPS